MRSVIDDCGVLVMVSFRHNFVKNHKGPGNKQHLLRLSHCLIFARRIGGGRQSHRYCRGSKQRPLRVQLIFSVTFTPLAPFALHFDT